MKKLVFMFVAMAAISFASCVNNDKAGQGADTAVNNDTMVNNDTVNNDSVDNDSVDTMTVNAEKVDNPAVK